MSKYAWIITRDHLCETNYTPDPDWDYSGTIGPSDATPEQIEDLKSGCGRTFYMYDDDDEWYYTGKMVGDVEEYCDRPLIDFGGPNAGCTVIRWHGKPGLTCEY